MKEGEIGAQQMLAGFLLNIGDDALAGLVHDDGMKIGGRAARHENADDE